MRQYETGPAGVHDLRNVCPGVAQTREDVLAFEQIAQFLEALVEHAQIEERLAVGLVGEAQERLHPMLAGRLCLGFQILLRRRGVVGRFVRTQIEHVGQREALLGCLAFGHQLGPGFGIPNGLQALAELHLAQAIPRFALHRQCRLQPEHEARATYLGDGGEVAVFAQFGQIVRLRLAGAFLGAGAVAEQDAPLGGFRHGLQHLEVGAHGLHQAVAGAYRLSDFHQFDGVREGAGNGTAVRQLVGRIAVGGKAHRAAVDGFRHHIGHLGAFLGGCLFFHGAFAHHVEAHGAMAHHAGHVQRRIKPLDGVQIAAVVFPVPRQAGEDGVLRNVLNGLHHRRKQLHILWLAGCEGDAAVAEQSGGDAVPAHRRHLRIPADLRV